jgi:hypothetical protein
LPTRKLRDAWSRRFEPPVPLPDGGELETLDQARTFIIGLPEEVHRTPAWQTAIEALLLLVAEHKGPTMFARIALMQVLYPAGELVYDASRKDPVWRSQRRLARDQ